MDQKNTTKINWPTEEEQKKSIALMVEDPEEYERRHGSAGQGARQNLLNCARKGMLKCTYSQLQSWFNYCDVINLWKRQKEEGVINGKRGSSQS